MSYKKSYFKTKGKLESIKNTFRRYSKERDKESPILNFA